MEFDFGRSVPDVGDRMSQHREPGTTSPVERTADTGLRPRVRISKQLERGHRTAVDLPDARSNSAG